MSGSVNHPSAELAEAIEREFGEYCGALRTDSERRDALDLSDAELAEREMAKFVTWLRTRAGLLLP